MSKTAKEMVADALTKVLTDMWSEAHSPYRKPEDYPVEFQKYCENQLFFTIDPFTGRERRDFKKELDSLRAALDVKENTHEHS
jgi:hypothetical protein